jgi:flagellum-specific ATP synthase
MIAPPAALFESVRARIDQTPTAVSFGVVTGVVGLIVEAEGPDVGLGEICEIS